MMIGEVNFDKEGMTYGLLYAEPFKDWDTGETKAMWGMKFYTSEKSRKRSIGKIAQPGRPVFLFVLSIKQVAELGRPLPFTPDEKRRDYKAPDGFYDKTIFQSGQ
jgi:hypothetical protein